MATAAMVTVMVTLMVTVFASVTMDSNGHAAVGDGNRILLKWEQM